MSTVRRSQRRKRQAPTTSSASASASSKKHKTVEADLPEPSHPSLTTSSLYKPCRQTLFLAAGFDTILWEPPKEPGKVHESFTRNFHPHGNDVHSYFTGPHAAKLAASSTISIYRHIGHIVLHKFQQLEGLSKARQWFPQVQASSEKYINMKDFIEFSWFENDSISGPLESLSAHQDDPWPAPFIVIVARRDDLIRACDVDTFNDDFDLPVEIFASRLLFELIACRDIRALFDELIPSVPFEAIPPPTQHPVVYERSPPIPRNGGGSLAAVLRDAESTGYASLTNAQREKIDSVLNVTLYPHQEQTVRWMLDKENCPRSLNEEFWEERYFTDSPFAKGGSFFYFPMSGEVRLRRPPTVRGGMVAEEMGLGKTVEALAVIACQRTERNPEVKHVWCEEKPPDVSVLNNRIKLKRLHARNVEKCQKPVAMFQHDDELLDDDSEIEFPCSVRVKRWPASTTLVVCPDSLLGQWKQEVHNRAPSLSVVIWKPTVSGSPGTSPSVAIGEHASDIVLATYDMVRYDTMLSRIVWRRLILDEAQVTRRSAALVAKDVFNLRCETRFLMTGTPLVTSINDLKGQFACLKIWPFSLEEDGFWEAYISYPFSLGCDVPQLHQMLAHTMIRHSKAQNLQLTLPSRSYETIRVDLAASHRACYYYVLGSCLDEIEAQSHPFIDTRSLRPLLKLLVALCLSPELLDVVVLDMSRRFTWSRRRPTSNGSSSNGSSQLHLSLDKVSPQDAIRFVAECSAGIVRDSNRAFAGSSSRNSPELVKYLKMSILELRKLVLEKGLLTQPRAVRTGKDRLVALAAGGVHRVATDTLTDLRATATRLGVGTEDEVSSWSRAKVKAKLYMHYDMLNGVQACRTVHESGFTAMSKLIDKKGSPSCPVCLTEVEGRLTVTKCGHLYCYDCIMLMLGATDGPPRCAICRRELSPNSMVEIIREKTEEEKETARKEEAKMMEDAAKQLLGLTQFEAGGASGDNGVGVDQESSNDNEEILMSRPTAAEAWAMFEQIGPAPSAFMNINRDECFPSLGPEILRHIAAARMPGATPPKMVALLRLINSSPEDTKFCVVAGSVDNLRLIYSFLKEQGIGCVGAGESMPGSSESRSMARAAEMFATVPSVRVFLLNPSNAAGLTLTSASVVVFMETLVRVADEIQAAARVHRIGQTKSVRIVRIIARGTVEENIVAQRGEITNAAEESRALATISNHEASDRLILQLFLPDFDDAASQDSGSHSDDSDADYDSSFE